MGGPPPSPAGAGPQWRKLSPLTILVRGGRGVVLLAIYAAEGRLNSSSSSGLITLSVVVALTLLFMLAGFIHWKVTRWALDGPVLRIETGLLRRDARQVPLARIQAVDVLNPLLARLFGLAEVRVRVPGQARSNARLAYIPQAEALDLRARLLAGHHGLDPSTPEPAEVAVNRVPTGALVASTLISAPTITAIIVVVAIVVSSSFSTAVTASLGGFLGAYLLGFATQSWRRIVDQYGFSVAVAPDGIRVRRGLFSKVAETIPLPRVQAVRLIEPLPWRPFGWCRLEVEVAGSAGQEQGRGSGRTTKALLPVGSRAEADQMFASLLGLRQFPLARPPKRTAWKAPLRYHFLAGGCDGQVVAASTGRLRKVTAWVPVEKIQSVRTVQGPLQRRLNLATVCADAAGRRVSASLRDRDLFEADALVEQLVNQSREARRQAALRDRPTGPQSPTGSPTVEGPPYPIPAPGQFVHGTPPSTPANPWAFPPPGGAHHRPGTDYPPGPDSPTSPPGWGETSGGWGGTSGGWG